MLYGLTGWHVMIVLSLWIVPFVLWLIALVQIAKSKAAAGAVVAWVVIVTLIPVVGAILWFVVGRRAVRDGFSAGDETA
ncbi:PLDc N-terminal domain-containing protein [Leifsonia shinshuensis]|uniref:ABC-type Zn uptake system ZnuABC Zn-binding protein ZnuA n=1 Tax=Leifsonia shinshuensis TaxID=150026 RepID=A0A853CUY2_9MICO|nr:PLDc N-terminal domain-containing protein [Leifsonia shinshuensis]NYJ24886.1 ABC-type Zn uptake system ZnuABC Zn-binding protein ZnuA [Leifsonia shinshuensis]